MSSETSHTSNRGRIATWVGGIVAAVIAGVAVAVIVNWINDPDGPPPSAVITDPATGAYVDRVARVAGTSSDIDDPTRVMLIVYWPDGRRYYPAAEPLDFEANGDWSGRASVGQGGDSGVGFDLILVLNDDRAQRQLMDYLEPVVAGGSAPGITDLPEGAQRLDTTSVTRL